MGIINGSSKCGVLFAGVNIRYVLANCERGVRKVVNAKNVQSVPLQSRLRLQRRRDVINDRDGSR